MSFIDFNAEEVEPNAAPEALPAGDYVAQVVGSEVKPTASGSGEYLKLEIEILTPGFRVVGSSTSSTSETRAPRPSGSVGRSSPPSAMQWASFASATRSSSTGSHSW